MAKVTTREVSNVTMQAMHHAGLNPFAVELLVESFAKYDRPEPITFVYRGVEVSLKVYDGPIAQDRDAEETREET